MTRKPRIRNAALLAAMATAGHNNRTLAKACDLARPTISEILNRRVEPKPITKRTIARVDFEFPGGWLVEVSGFGAHGSRRSTATIRAPSTSSAGAATTRRRSPWARSGSRCRPVSRGRRTRWC